MNALQGIKTMKPHIALNVTNVERSIEFYRALFGIEPSKVRSAYAKFDVDNPPLNLTLNQGPVTDRGALSHLGIQVPSTQEVIAIAETWRQAGLEARDEMQTACCFAVQDKVWASDPDGYEWEAFTVLQDNLPEAGSGSCCTPASLAETKASLGATVPLASAEPCCEPGSGCC